jgi:hypothetical protein
LDGLSSEGGADRAEKWTKQAKKHSKPIEARSRLRLVRTASSIANIFANRGTEKAENEISHAHKIIVNKTILLLAIILKESRPLFKQEMQRGGKEGREEPVSD